MTDPGYGAAEGLTGKVAVVTGAGRGIGRGIAIDYAAAGATVVCAARTGEEVQGTVAMIEEVGGTGMAVVADVTSVSDVERLFSSSAERFGGIDLIMLNAGVTGARLAVEDSDPEAWRVPIEVNLIGTYLCARGAIPFLKARGGGKIIVMGSGARLHMPATLGLSAYAVSKIGAWMFVRALAQELRPHRIAVNEIIPGPVNTGLLQQGRRLHPTEWFKEPADVARFARFVALLPDDGPTGQSFSMLARDSAG